MKWSLTIVLVVFATLAVTSVQSMHWQEYWVYCMQTMENDLIRMCNPGMKDRIVQF